MKRSESRKTRTHYDACEERKDGRIYSRYVYNEDECSPLPEELKQRAERCGVETRKLKSTAEVV